MMRQSTICSPPCQDIGGQQQHRQQQQQQQLEQEQQPRGTASFVTTVQPNDVLMGRGQPVMVNQGNQAFIEIIRSRSAEYHSIKSRKQKHIIAQQIASTVRSKRGLFLRKIETPQEAKKLGVPVPVPASDTVWAVVDESAVLLKIKQALRDQGLIMDKQSHHEVEPHVKLTQKRPRKSKQALIVAKVMSTNSVNDGETKTMH